jgi:hypothetical protein
MEVLLALLVSAGIMFLGLCLDNPPDPLAPKQDDGPPLGTHPLHEDYPHDEDTD